MSNSVQFPSHKAIGTAEIQNNSCFPRAAQKGLEAGSTIQSSSSEGFFSAIITKIVNFFKWIFCCGSSEKLSEFGKYFENNIKRAWTQYSGPDDDTARVKAAVRIVAGEVGNMEEPKRLNFRLEVARELVKNGLATNEQKKSMNQALQAIFLHIVFKDVNVTGTTLETTLKEFADKKSEIDKILTKEDALDKHCMELYMKWIGNNNNFTGGEAVNNGDCFFAAFAEALSNLKGEQFTHKQMRQDVAKASRSEAIINRIK